MNFENFKRRVKGTLFYRKLTNKIIVDLGLAPTRKEGNMSDFNLSLFLIFLILCILKTALTHKNKNH